MYDIHLHCTLVMNNVHLQTIEKIVLEPENENFTKTYVENQPVLWKGFR